MTAELSGETYEHWVYDSKDQVPFRHVDHLGLGSFGIVDKVQRTSGPFQGKVYARKVLFLPKNTSERERVLASIQNEVRIAKSVRHRHVVRLIETYLCGKKYAMIMTPAAEENLREYLSRVDGSLLDPGVQELRERIPPWFRCLVSAVTYLHAQDIRHRDIKPLNILIRNGNILLTDFGAAMRLPGETIPVETGTRGTKKYCAPEMAKGYRSGRPADIYSLGVVFLEMLSVHSGFKELARSSDLPQSNSSQSNAGSIDSQSNASNVDIVSQWIGSLKNTPRDAPWYAAVLFLCRNMLQIERGQRPTADAVRLCWSYQPFSALPPTPCECSKSPDGPDRYRIEGVNKALRKASGNGHKLAVCLLIENGAAINHSGALILASREGQRDIVQILLEKGGGVEERDKRGGTALHAAAERGRDEVVLLLLKKGADIRAKDNGEQTALHRAASRGHEAAVQLLLSKSANVAAKDNDGWTALHVAAKNGHEGAIQLLVGGGADVEAKDNNKLTAQSLAERPGHTTAAQLLARLLAERKDKVETKKDGIGSRLLSRKRKHSEASSTYRTPHLPPENPPPQIRPPNQLGLLPTPPSSSEDTLPHPQPRQEPGQFPAPPLSLEDPPSNHRPFQDPDLLLTPPSSSEDPPSHLQRRQVAGKLSASPSSPEDPSPNPRPSQGPDLLPTPPPSADDSPPRLPPVQGPGPPFALSQPLKNPSPSQPQPHQGIGSRLSLVSPPKDPPPPHSLPYQRQDSPPIPPPPPKDLPPQPQPPLHRATDQPPTQLLSQSSPSTQTPPRNEPDRFHTSLPPHQCHSSQFLSQEDLRDFYFPAIHRNDTDLTKRNTLDSATSADALATE
ncbi:hypothetical protein GP486_003333 [Trichoglossum hirsutum]|uniref:Protein kinase domain-containing protein n=1 Tax=Trichoglossum hirsutum TaxID=265104 RepID=A0A9P8LD93_9PEZI|nr:hypothetical protein GP486_003333 [Trichoglossum hirsutum]